MRHYELDKTQSLKRPGVYRLGIFHFLAWVSSTPVRLRNLAIGLLLALGLIFGGLAFFLVNQGPANQTAISSVPQLGVLYISSNVAFRNLPVSPAVQGLVITEVKPGSSASQAG